MLKDVKYHGHDITVVFDWDGNKYNIGKGLTVFVDGKNAEIKNNEVYVGKPVIGAVEPQKQNFALNIVKKGFPKPSASINNNPDTSLFQAIDGRVWYFPEIINYWSTRGSQTAKDWYALEFDKSKRISEIRLYPYVDNKTFFVPDSLYIEYSNGKNWLPIIISKQTPAGLTANTCNDIQFTEANAAAIRVNLMHRPNRQVALTEIEAY